MFINAFKKIIACTVLCASEMVFMFIPRCSPPGKNPLDVDVVESLQCAVEEEVLSAEEEALILQVFKESKMLVCDEE